MSFKNGEGIEGMKTVSEMLGHANIGITLDTYSHVLPRLQEAAAERFDEILDESGFGDSNVSKMLANSEDLASRPCRSLTCDTLIKSQANIFPLFRAFSKLESARKFFNF